MSIKFLALTALAATALAGCDNSDHTIIAGGKPKPAVEPIDPVTLPPSIVASKTYRCKDNSLVYIDWMSDQTARVKSSKTDVGAPPAEGELTGTAADSSVKLKGKSCKA